MATNDSLSTTGAAAADEAALAARRAIVGAEHGTRARAYEGVGIAWLCDCGAYGDEGFDTLDAAGLAADEHVRAELAQAPPAVVRITSAPEEYDGFGTRTMELLPERGRVARYRRVAILERHLDWQRLRYASGLFACVGEDEFAGWVERGLA
jgi:hypothetical protein